MAKHQQQGAMGTRLVNEAVTALEQLRTALLETERALVKVGQAGPSVPRLSLETPRRFAGRLRVSAKDVRSWVQRGLPHIKLGDKIRIMSIEADAWLRDQQGAQMR